MSYDNWKLATPTEYERDDEETCDECDTLNLRDFVHPADGVFVRKRCEACEACEEVEGVRF